MKFELLIRLKMGVRLKNHDFIRSNWIIWDFRWFANISERIPWKISVDILLMFPTKSVECLQT